MAKTGAHLRIQDLGTNAQGVRLRGDRDFPEHAEFYVTFPGGSVGVCRTSDGEYWAHVHVNRREVAGHDPEVPEGEMTDARVDVAGRHAGEGEIDDPGLYHLAVRVDLRKD